MADNFLSPFFSFESSDGVVSGPSFSTIDLGTVVQVIENYYGVGYVELYHSLRLVSVVDIGANVGSVLDESALRRDLGTWHRTRAGFVTATHKIEYESQEFTWTGNRYPFERSRAADPGLIVPSVEFKMNYTNASTIPVRADLVSLTPRRRDGDDGFSGVPFSTLDQPIPQYEIGPLCMQLSPSGSDITFNFFQPDNYKKLGGLLLRLDDDSIVIRPFRGVSIAIEYRSYIIVVSEDSNSRRVVGAEFNRQCPSSLPIYPDMLTGPVVPVP
jgi:hypothetical protein